MKEKEKEKEKKPAEKQPIFIVGLQKDADGKNYHVVTGTAETPLVDPVKSPLQYAMRQLKMEMIALSQRVP